MQPPIPTARLALPETPICLITESVRLCVSVVANTLHALRKAILVLWVALVAICWEMEVGLVRETYGVEELIAASHSQSLSLTRLMIAMNFKVLFD